jgi:hypothetical protein
MTLAESTRYRTRRVKSAAEVMADLDRWKLARLAVWLVFCILLVVLA